MTLKRREALGFLMAAGAAWLCGSRRAEASLAVAIKLPDLVKRSRLVAFSTSLERSSRWEEIGRARRIVTYHRVRLDEPVAGEAPGSEIWVRTLGGRLGDVAQIVHGEAQLVLGEPCLLFVALTADGVNAVTELAQGHFPLKNDGRGTRRLARSPRLGTLFGEDGSAVKALVGKSRPEALDLIHEVQRAKK